MSDVEVMMDVRSAMTTARMICARTDKPPADARLPCAGVISAKDSGHTFRLTTSPTKVPDKKSSDGTTNQKMKFGNYCAGCAIIRGASPRR
jgi:hypothetical protein